jgi:signal transduction histidine kinase
MILSQLLRNLSKKAPGSFATKIFVAQALSIVIISLVFTVYFIHRERSFMLEILMNKGGLLAQQLADTCRIGVFAESTELLADPMNTILAQKEVLSARVFTTGGKLLIERCSSELSDRGETDTDSGKPPNGVKRLPKGAEPLSLHKESAIEFWTPIRSTPGYSPEEALLFTDSPEQKSEPIIGFVGVTLDTKHLNAAFRGLLLKSAFICLAFLACALAIAYYVARGISKPLNSLKERVNALGSGIEMDKMPVKTGDEIGELSVAFNAMAESLRIREEEKEHLSAQLLHAQKMEAIGQLAGGVAHDFNNILCAIIGFGALLEMGMRKDDPARNHLKQILSAADRATNLTQGLLAFGRKQVINPRPTDLNEVVRNIEKMLTRLITEDIELRLCLADRKLNVLVDSGQIDQVLLNLATNARDAMPQGGILTIETGEEAPPEDFLADVGTLPFNRFAVLTVTDTGTGMEGDIRERIFEPFFTTKEVGKGTGLGLSMVYGIVKQHKGHITVGSKPGTGTSFRTYLPLSPEESLPGMLDDEIPHLPLVGTETILVVEDNPAVRNLNRTVLEAFGYRILEAEDGEDAVTQFLRHRDDIDLVVMDVVMPKMNGRQACAKIVGIRPDVRVLFTSGYTEEIVQQKGIFTEGLNFLNKPMTPVDLLKKVRELLDA